MLEAMDDHLKSERNLGHAEHHGEDLEHGARPLSMECANSIASQSIARMSSTTPATTSLASTLSCANAANTMTAAMP